MRFRQRITRIEEYRGRRMPPSHFLMSVRVPWDLPAGMDQETWLAEEVACPCGQRECPDFRIGLVIPEKATTAEAWAEWAQTYYAQRRGCDA
jgi:hypothetical protein